MVPLSCWPSGAKAALRALSPQAGLQAQAGSASLPTVLGSTLAMTYLNPHVYLDTVVLLGTVGAQQPAGLQLPFAAGASVASWMWFSLLGFGAAAVAPALRRPAVYLSCSSGITLMRMCSRTCRREPSTWRAE